MTAAQRRYLRFEAAIAAVINGVLSAIFVLATFGGRLDVTNAELVRDAAPQTFFVAMFTILVPGLLTRRRIRAGVIAPLPQARGRRVPIVLRALLVAAGVTVIAVGLHAALLPRLHGGWFLPGLLLYKVAYGAALGAVIARLTLPSELI